MHPYMVEGKACLVRLFVRGQGAQSDLDLLRTLGLEEFTAVPVEHAGYSPPTVLIGNTDDWVAVADCGTLLYHPHHKQSLVAKLADTCSEVFWCALPDTDETFKFDYWHNGKLRRSYHLSPVGWTGEQTLQQSPRWVFGDRSNEARYDKNSSTGTTGPPSLPSTVHDTAPVTGITTR